MDLNISVKGFCFIVILVVLLVLIALVSMVHVQELTYVNTQLRQDLIVSENIGKGVTIVHRGITIEAWKYEQDN